jgi:hypothetical protein
MESRTASSLTYWKIKTELSRYADLIRLTGFPLPPVESKEGAAPALSFFTYVGTMKRDRTPQYVL